MRTFPARFEVRGLSRPFSTIVIAAILAASSSANARIAVVVVVNQMQESNRDLAENVTDLIIAETVRSLHTEARGTNEFQAQLNIPDAVGLSTCSISPSCLARIGTLLDADTAIVAHIDGANPTTRRRITLALWNLSTSTVRNRTSKELGVLSTDITFEVVTALAELFKSEPGTLSVSSEPKGANLLLDGSQVGEIPLVVPGLPPGQHSLESSLSGFQTMVQTVTIDPGSLEAVTIHLAPKSINYVRPSIIAMSVIGAISVAVGILFGIESQHVASFGTREELQANIEIREEQARHANQGFALGALLLLASGTAALCFPASR